MSGAHEGCSQGKSVRDREGSKHSTAATPERVDSEAAVLPQDFEDSRLKTIVEYLPLPLWVNH